MKEGMITSLSHEAGVAAVAFQRVLQGMPGLRAALDSVQAAGQAHQALANTARYANSAEGSEPSFRSISAWP